MRVFHYQIVYLNFVFLYITYYSYLKKQMIDDGLNCSHNSLEVRQNISDLVSHFDMRGFLRAEETEVRGVFLKNHLYTVSQRHEDLIRRQQPS